MQKELITNCNKVYNNRACFILNESIADIITADINEKIALRFADSELFASSRECHVIAFPPEHANKMRSTKRTENSCLL